MVLRKRRGLLLTTVGLILFIIYLTFSNPFRAFQEVRRFNLSLFLVSIVINYLGLVFFAASWYLLLRGMDVGIRLSGAIRATFISLFVVLMIPIPVGTEIIRAYLVRKEENSDIGKGDRVGSRPQSHVQHLLRHPHHIRSRNDHPPLWCEHSDPWRDALVRGAVCGWLKPPFRSHPRPTTAQDYLSAFSLLDTFSSF